MTTRRRFMQMIGAACAAVAGLPKTVEAAKVEPFPTLMYQGIPIKYVKSLDGFNPLQCKKCGKQFSFVTHGTVTCLACQECDAPYIESLRVRATTCENWYPGWL